MYGQFGGMQQSMQKLSQEIRVMNYIMSCDGQELPHQTPFCEAVNKSEHAVYHPCFQAANSHQRSLESEVRVRTAAMESFDEMNSSLISANIGLQVKKSMSLNLRSPASRQLHTITEKAGLISKRNFPLQKSLLENCQNRVDKREEVKSLRSNYEKTQEKLRDKERELAAAHAENQTLRLQVVLHTHLSVYTLTRSHKPSCIHISKHYSGSALARSVGYWSPSCCDKWVLRWPAAAPPFSTVG